MDREDLIIAILKETRDDVKGIQENVSEMKVDVALNKDDLKLHMKRSDNLEELVKIKDKEVDFRIKSIEKKLTVSYLFKLILSVASAVGVVSGAVYGVARFF